VKPPDPSTSVTRADDHVPQPSARRDLAWVLVVTALSAALGVLFDVSELAYRWTRRVEQFQLDELPATLFVLACGLAWFAWRRYRESQRELQRRRTLEEEAERLLTENRRLANQGIAAQETERRRLARELHDELGQYLNSILLDAARIRDLSVQREPEINRVALGLIQHAHHVYREIGGMIRRLRPIALDEFGLPSALEHCVEGWRMRLPQASFSLTVKGDFSGLADSLNIMLYRLVQEGLTNVSKFARDAKVEIYLVRTPLDDTPGYAGASDGEIIVTIRDDGPGTDLSKPREGLGLIGMRERVEALGGEFHLASQPACGFLLCARVPVQAARVEPNGAEPAPGDPEDTVRPER
jgi:two-component system, NarL family, sensor histidine kinase UhpB